MLFALDLATSTGWCAGSGEKSPELGSVRMPDTKEEVGPFLDFYEKWLNMQLAEYEPTMVLFEAPLLPKAKIDNTGHLVQAPTTIATTRKLQGLAGITEMVCYRRKIEVREVFLQTVKKALAGDGRADKVDMMSACRRCGLAPKTFDEADAFGVWIVGVRHYAKPFQQLWDQRLYGARHGNLPL